MGKHGAPVSALWGAAGFAQIYEYDLLLGLGMASQASAAKTAFDATYESYPVANSYWFYDYTFPTYRDHGKTQWLTQFFALMAQYYPASGGKMQPLNWGQYIHFASGAAGTSLKEQATYAFGWTDTWEAQLQKAQTDFPAIKY